MIVLLLYERSSNSLALQRLDASLLREQQISCLVHQVRIPKHMVSAEIITFWLASGTLCPTSSAQSEQACWDQRFSACT